MNDFPLIPIPMPRALLLLLVLAVVASFFNPSAAEDRKAKVLSDKAEVESAGHWIYNDLAKGFAQSNATGKPMLVVFRCLP